MILIVTRDPDLAQRIGACLVDERRYVVGELKAKDLRHEVYKLQPDLILLDVTYGGNAYRVLESVPNIIRKTESRPFIILITPRASKQVDAEAAKAGCFDVFNVDRTSLKTSLARVVSKAVSAREAGEASFRILQRVVH